MQDFEKMKSEVKKVALETIRIDNEAYFEAVVNKQSLSEAVCVLEKMFAQKAGPGVCNVPKDIEKVIKCFGGLRQGQSLYLSSEEKPSAFAMLWPWQDGERVTLKMAKV